MNRLFVNLAALALAGSAFSQTAFWTGDTTGGPTWERPFGFSGISVGNFVTFDVQPSR